MCNETLKAFQNIMWVWMEGSTKEKKRFSCARQGKLLWCLGMDARLNMWGTHRNPVFSSLCRRWRSSLWILNGDGHILFSPVSVGASLLPWTLWSVVPEVVRKARRFGLAGNYSALWHCQCSTLPTLKSALNGKSSWEYLSRNTFPTK